MSFITAFFAWLALTLGVGQPTPCSQEMNVSSSSPPIVLYARSDDSDDIYNGY